MGAATREVMGLIEAVAVTLGPLVFLIALLNRRDRRQAALLVTASNQLSSSALRSDVSIAVQSALWSRQGRVAVDLGPSSQEEVWSAIMRLRRALPAEVRLTVNGCLGWSQPARLTVESVGEALSRRAA